jgi:superfamily I DNA/RNA helicase
LSENSKTVTATGDDDQAIFSFKGASSGIFKVRISSGSTDVVQSFLDAFPETKLFNFVNNYRSPPDLIKAERRLISHNPNRLEVLYGISKEMKTVFEDSDPNEKAVHHLNFPTKMEEEEGVAAKIEELITAPTGETEPAIAVLVRNNSDIPKFAKRLMQREVPVNFSGVSYDEPEISLLMTFLSTIIQPSNSKSLYNLIISPAYSFPPSDLAKITEIHIRNKVTLREVLKQVATNTPLITPEGVTVVLTEEAVNRCKV